MRPVPTLFSPLLSNWALDGLELVLDKEFGSTANQCNRIPYHARKLVHLNGVKICRYADDFIITGTNRELLENKVKPIVESFLKERGLELSHEKTVITHTTKGFDFLGQNIRRYQLRNGGSKFLIKPSEKNIKTFLKNVRAVIKAMQAEKQLFLIQRLNPMIRGWSNYHRHVVSTHAFKHVDYQIWIALWRWAKRRHPNKGKHWISHRYFHKVGDINRHFSCVEKDNKGNLQSLILSRAQELRIKRHTVILPTSNPFDEKYDAYFEKRLSNKMHNIYNGGYLIKQLIELQKGICTYCNELISSKGNSSKWNKSIIRFRKRSSKGGTLNINNLQLLHSLCHEHSWDMYQGQDIGCR